MTAHPDPEQLLGGFATQTLTQEERKILFEAALQDQGLFDALAEEEALRALLADPKARRQLLKALPKPHQPLWRRPSLLAVAATSVAALLTTWNARRRSTDIDTPKVRPLPEPVPQSPAPSQATPIPAPSSSHRVKSPDTVHKAPAPAPPAEALGVQPPAAKAEREPFSLDRKAEAAAAALAPAARQAVPSEMKTLTPPVPAQADLQVVAAEAASAAPMPAPTWTLEPLAGNRHRLTVKRPPQGHLYVLLRAPGGPVPLVPQPSPQGDRYEWQGDDPVDLYLLRTPTPHPEHLPASTPVDGFRQRLRPN